MTEQPTKEFGIAKPTPFDGDRNKAETFVQECKVYLHTNRHIYTTDESKIAFTLSYMTEKEALKWKLTYLRKITNAEGDFVFPSGKEFMKEIATYFAPTNISQSAIHQLAMLKQGKKTAEQIITDFRLLVAQAGYAATTASDHLHLIEKLQNVLNPSIVKKIMLMDDPPTTIDEWIKKALTLDMQYRMTMEVINRRMAEGKPKKEERSGNARWTSYFDRKPKAERDPNAMDVDAMTTEKRATLMKKGLCFICEEQGHRAQDHKSGEWKGKKKNSFPKRRSRQSKKSMPCYKHYLWKNNKDFSTCRKEEKRRKKRRKKIWIFKEENCLDVSVSCNPIYCSMSNSSSGT